MRNFFLFSGLAMFSFISLGALGDLKEQSGFYQPNSSEESVFNAVIKDSEYGKPIYLYSRTGLPYRCFIAPSGLPLNCRQTEEGQETIEAIKQFKPRFQ